MSAMRRRAFTLVELLVVIGIIAVLTALLLPVLSGARRKATQVACLSNLRQLGAALFAYAGENRGWFPGPASGRDVYPEDWVHWQQGRDVNAGSIVPFLGRNTRVLVCPLGLAERPLEPYQASSGPYRFSYSVNVRFTGWGGNLFGSVWSIKPCRLGKAVNPSRKILAVEEDSQVINDGAWWGPDPDYYPDSRAVTGPLSVRHDGDGREFHGRDLPGALERLARTRRGNAFFADGHGEFFLREFTQYAPFIGPHFVDNPLYFGPRVP